MSYAVKEIFKSLQGEGVNTGRVAVFCRFAGCNLWTGREDDRGDAACDFCDTDFIGADAGKFATAKDLADAIEAEWDGDEEERFVILTGGEPGLQVDTQLVQALRARRFYIAIETNGPHARPENIDWVCVSPKGSSEIVIAEGEELKLVYPQSLAAPERFQDMLFDHFVLQPKDGADVEQNTGLTIDYCRRHPKWRFGLQTHKTLNVR